MATAKDRGWLPPSASPDTAAYCRARDALAAEGLQKAVEHTAQALDAGVSDEHLWLGRQVQVVDGTGIALPDTEAQSRRLSSALTAKARLRLSRVAPGRLHVSGHRRGEPLSPRQPP